ncbi:MAG: hypothetical protein U0234_14725 [Sandaracinus sp.]
MRARPILALALTLAGCTASRTWADTARDADETALWSATITALLVVPGNIDAAETPALTAMRAAAQAMDPFDPNECITTSVDGATIVYHLDGCASSFDLVHATGDLVVTYAAPDAGRTVFHASATHLQLNGHAATFEADARVLHEAAMRTIDATVTAEGALARGAAVSITSTQTARWMDSWGCLFVDDATDEVQLGGETWTARTRALTMCIGECPMTGGEVAWSRGPDALSVSYPGGRAVSWSLASGGTTAAAGSFDISCGP